MNTPVIIGIDPGQAGAIAALDAATGTLVWLEDMPTLDRRVQAPLLADLLAGEVIVAAWIEQVGGWAGQAAGGAFRFGHATGTVVGVLGALRAPLHEVTPANWKKAAKVGKDKGSSRRAAIDLWPAHSASFARVRDDGRAEAALIGRHGWLQHRTEVAG